MKLYRARNTDVDVLTSAKERIRECFHRFDTVEVLFSGGKDSTVVLHLTLDIARELNRLPLRVVFFDEEVLHPPTVEYVERVAQNPELDFKWYCLEIKHRNACSNESPYWYCWDKEHPGLWVRPFPEKGIAEHPRFKKGMSIPDFNPFMPDLNDGSLCHIMGIRAAESLRRRSIMLIKKDDNWLSFSGTKQNLFRAYPIYDWTTDDVWIAPGKFGWDYNKTYDVYEKAGLTQHRQRVCPPYGEEPLRGLSIYAECWPELWHKMIARVPGAATAARYANSELYSYGKLEKPANVTWREHMLNMLELYPINVANEIRKNINEMVKRHHSKSILPISEEDPDPVSGVCWQWLCKLVIKGDIKGRTKQKATDMAEKANNKTGLSFTEAKRRFGKTRMEE